MVEVLTLGFPTAIDIDLIFGLERAQQIVDEVSAVAICRDKSVRDFGFFNGSSDLSLLVQDGFERWQYAHPILLHSEIRRQEPLHHGVLG